ncbi:MAG: tRNA uridine-5-carboxymethylaminomethyl(34) synthesis GTPase MnmE [Lachnospiraceae bacterium]|nr:tRNA uridine-5-carboxymethylaminomethyl(34) synthesis GTPase MnmE [Lachnospiraceae bacterium]
MLNNFNSDTIAAVATALSDSGIGIVRISGPEAIDIADKVFCTKIGKRKLKNVDSHTIHYGYIVDCKDENNILSEGWQNYIIDEVMVAVMKAPKSYTMEDTVEINCHGGVLVMQKILETVLKHGARLAQPGEFTKRAFLNGRIDLSKAEAVIDVIHSQNEFALQSSINQLQGNLSKEVRSLREEIIYEIAFIESALDDPEHISLDGYKDKIDEKVSNLSERVEKLLATADNGRLMKEGISTVIVGKPNAGKSSLLNIMVGEERAIVTDIAGTTRDVLQESIKLHGIGLNIIDTAGIRTTEDVVEKIGVEKAKKYANEADLILYVVDASVALDDSDREIITLLEDKNVIVLLNKSDLTAAVEESDLLQVIDELVPGHKKIEMIRTSTKDNTGIDTFENTIKEMFFKGNLKNNNQIVITNMRHKEALQNTYDSLQMVKRSLMDDMPEDFYSIDLMSAYSSLGFIIGEEVDDDLVNEIFTKFCMGK